MTRRPASLRPAPAWVAALLLTSLVALVPTGRARAAAGDLPADLEIVPRDAAAFFHFRAADIYKAEWMGDLRRILDKAGPEHLKTFTQKFAPDPSTIDRVTLVMMTPRTLDHPFPRVDPEAVSAMVIVSTSKPYDRLKVMQSLGLREKLYKRHVYYFNEDLWSGLVLVDNQTFLIAAEDTIIDFFDRQAKGKGDGALLPALKTAAEKHMLTVGLNPPLLGKEAGGFLPLPLAKLLESRCATMTLDKDKEVRYALRLDYAKEDGAKDGAKALRDTLDLAREQLKQPVEELEKILKKDAGKAPVKDLPENFAALVGLGLLRELDGLLKEAPIQAKGTAVTMELTYNGLQSAQVMVVGMMAVTAIGTNAVRTFQELGGGPQEDPEKRLKKIQEALDKYHAEKGSYPPPAISDKDGRPLLSWRVALLPYMGDQEKALYKEFNLAEPWDSLHNKKLLKKLPQVYRSPNAYGQFKTATMVFSGEGNVFGPKGVKKSDLGPGAALLVEGNSDTVVYWSKPADFTITEGKPLPSFFGKYGYQRLYVLLADGTVRNFSKETDEKTIRALATRKGAKLEKPQDKE